MRLQLTVPKVDFCKGTNILSITLTLILEIGNGKAWCKGRNFPGGQECCESEDPEGSKCTEGQGDCDSDAGCAGNLVCGNNNCRNYHKDASPYDDCCTTVEKLISDVEKEGNGKPWCKGRNFSGGQECCESEDPEGSKCTEGQGDCDSDDGCAGNLVCGSNNCRSYHRDASPYDDCCTTASSHNYHGGKTGGLPSRLGPLGSTRTHGFRGKINKGGSKFIPDVGVDFTKFNSETYKEHYVDGFRNFDLGSVIKITVSGFPTSTLFDDRV